MKAHTLALLFQFFSMNQQDVYLYTLPHVHQSTFYYHGELCFFKPKYYGLAEDNPVSAWLIYSKLPDVLFLGGCAGAIGISNLLSDFDKDHLKGFPVGTSDIFMTILTFAEIQAIHSWAFLGLGPSEQSWTFAKIEF